MSKIERLTDEARGAITNCTDEAAWHAGCEALRIIDTLTAALEAAERSARNCEAVFDANCSIAFQLEVARAALSRLSAPSKDYVEVLEREICRAMAAESRAEALQARTAELESEVAIAWDDDAETKRANAAESELADLRGRVERALTVYSYFEIDLPAEVALRRIAEVLRGR